MYERLYINLSMAQLLMKKGGVLSVRKAALLCGGNATGYLSTNPSVNYSCFYDINIKDKQYIYFSQGSVAISVIKIIVTWSWEELLSQMSSAEITGEASDKAVSEMNHDGNMA